MHESGESEADQTKLKQLLHQDSEVERSTQAEATDFVKRLLESDHVGAIAMQFKQSLLLSASDLQSIVADKNGYLKKMNDFEA